MEYFFLCFESDGFSWHSYSFQKDKCVTKSMKSPVMIRADEVQSSLGTEHPSCMKTMVKTHVDFGYWMVMSLFLYGNL